MKKLLLSLILVVSLSINSRAEEQKLTPQQQKLEAAYNAAGKVAVFGPAKIDLNSEGSLNLPAGYAYIPTKEGKAIMDAMGNYASSEFIGIVTDGEGKMNWFIEIGYSDSGYIKDEEAKDWDVDGMLKGLTEATHAGNEQRVKEGLPTFEVTGWAQKPTYEAINHKLIWSIFLKDQGYEQPTINYNTYALGRTGYFYLDLVTGNDYFKEDKTHADTILAGLNFKEGRKYTDFNANTDRIAEYGIAALIAGVAAKKLGLLAMIGVFLLKGSKLLVLLGVFFATTYKKIFKRKSKKTATVDNSSPIDEKKP